MHLLAWTGHACAFPALHLGPRPLGHQQWIGILLADSEEKAEGVADVVAVRGQPRYLCDSVLRT